MSNPAYIHFYSSDWRSGCIGLTPEEEGMYVRICAFYYETGRRLFCDERAAASAMMVDVRMFRRLIGSLIRKGKVHEKEDGYSVPRCEQELAKAKRALGRNADAEEAVGSAREPHDAQYEDRGSQVSKRAESGDEVEVHETSDRLRRDFAETSPRLRREVYQKSQQNQCSFKEPEPEPEKKESCRLATTSGNGEAFEAFRIYNEIAQRIGLPMARSLTPQRKRSLEARLREHGLDGWRTAMANLTSSKHCRGDNDRGWRADFEFCLQAKSLARLIEGAYGTAAHEIAKPSDPNPVDGVAWGWWRPKAETYKAWPVDKWESALKRYPPNGTWPWWQIGPPPGDPECLVPAEIISKHGWVEIYRGKITH